MRSREVEAIKTHHLAPSRYKVTHERLLPIAASIDFSEGSELGVRTEDEIDYSAGPLEIAGRPIAPLQYGFRCSGLLPLRVHVEEIHEEIIGQCFGPFGENALFGVPEVCIQGAHAADQNRYLRSGQRQQVRPIHQQLSRRSLLSLANVIAEPVRDRLQNSE